MRYGVDIGNAALKVVGLKRTLRGYRLVGVARQRFGSDVTSTATRALREAFSSVGGKKVGLIGLSGRDINLQLVQQPAMKPVNYRTMMRYELEQRGGEADALYLDYCTLREPDAYFPNYFAMVGVGRRPFIDDRLKIAGHAGMDVRAAVPNPFALFAAYQTAYAGEGGAVLLLDIGADNMDTALVRGGRLIYARNVSSGAGTFDAAIAGMPGISLERAEHLKVKYGNLSGSEGESAKADEIRPTLRTAAGQLVGVIQSSINFSRIQLNEKELAIDRIYLSGGGARLQGFPEYLRSALKTEVELLDPFKGMDLSNLEDSEREVLHALPSDLATGVGLALLACARKPSVTLSLVPESLRKRHEFFRTKFALFSSAAVLLVTLFLLTVGAAIRRGAHRSALAEFRTRTEDVRRRIERLDAVEGEIRNLVAREDLLAGEIRGPQIALDTVHKLKQTLPDGVHISAIQLEEGTPRKRAAFGVKGRGVIFGEIRKEDDETVTLLGPSENTLPRNQLEGLVTWLVPGSSIAIEGEVDENIRGGARTALKEIAQQMADPSRAVRAELAKQESSPDKPGWRRFRIKLTFD